MCLTGSLFACCEGKPRTLRVVRNPFLTLEIQLLQLSVATAALVANQPHLSTNSQADGSGLPTATGGLCSLCCLEKKKLITGTQQEPRKSVTNLRIIRVQRCTFISASPRNSHFSTRLDISDGGTKLRFRSKCMSQNFGRITDGKHRP